MGLFSSKNNTISDEKWANIKKAAGRAEAKRGGMFSSKAIAQRKAHDQQMKKSRWS